MSHVKIMEAAKMSRHELSDPVEYLWKHTKYDDLANFVPLTTDNLEEHANASLATTRHEPTILRGYLDLAELPF